ncbi:hypothetical protein HYG86_03770 [Alkalicella caledoniensis]|uniref:Fluoroquinolone transport system permease protein n=1 Tax=Alkalicella caledoniensis TaxID=2731377 RepID=A0A7G9W5I6_ALKCA|nr:hypothetical protein [Alkalicella caledoniensis]QNO13948.1 hypothetical protein HYG86_03770 [Alkalicella caledoniensis]
MRKIISLGARDYKNLIRDYVLLISFMGPLLLTSFLYFVLPIATEFLLEQLNFDLKVYYPLIYVYLILFTPMIIGVFTGFIILDEKDDDILSYISVTELGKAGFISYRIISPTIISIAMSAITVNILPLAEVSMSKTVAMILIASLEAPLIALFLGSFAANKVEGLAYSKGLGLLNIAPAVSFLAQGNWRYMAGILPPFWINEIIMGKNIITTITFATAIHFVYLYLLVKKFSK